MHIKRTVNSAGGAELYELVPASEPQEWWPMDREAFGRLARAGYGGVPYQVVCWAIQHAENDNLIFINAADLARELDRNHSGLARSIRQLVKDGFLHYAAKVGSSWVYILDPDLTCQSPQETKRIRALIEEKKEALNLAS